MVKMTTNEIWLLLLLLTTATMMIGVVICPSLKFRMQNRGNVKNTKSKASSSFTLVNNPWKMWLLSLTCWTLVDVAALVHVFGCTNNGYIMLELYRWLVYSTTYSVSQYINNKIVIIEYSNYRNIIYKHILGSCITTLYEFNIVAQHIVTQTSPTRSERFISFYFYLVCIIGDISYYICRGIRSIRGDI